MKNQSHQRQTLISIQILLLVIGMFLLTFFSASCEMPSTPSETMAPTVVIVTPTIQPTPPQTSQTTETTTPSVHHELLSIEDYGSFSSGHTLMLPDGYWYNTTDTDQLTHVDNLTVTTDGPGRPTLSRTDDQKAILTIRDCTDITFEQIRFGFDKAKWPDGTQADDSALIKLVNANRIRFKNCEFFSGSGVAVLLDASENIFFENCTFYNIVGAPFQTGHAYLPSQINCTDCLFETVESGVLPLNLHHSIFDRCTWIGQKGYRVPVPAINRIEGELIAEDPNQLPKQLSGILATKIRHLIDDSQRLTLINAVFSSDEVYSLYERMDSEASSIMPEQTLDWSLTGQKKEEAKPGQALDPTLGLKITLRTHIKEEILIRESDSGTQTIRQPRYSLSELITDLLVIKHLKQDLDPLITGSLSILMSDQYRRPLVELAIPVDQLETWIDINSQDTFMTQSNLVLLHPELNPSLFLENNRFGQYTPNHFLSALKSSFGVTGKPLIVYPQDEACLVQYQIEYTGSRIDDSVVYHQYQLLLNRAGAQDALSEPRQDRFQLAAIRVRADNGEKQISDQSTLENSVFRLPSDEQRLILWPLLQEPIVTDSQQVLQPLTIWAEEASDMMPVFIRSSSSDRIVLNTVYFNEFFDPELIEITAVKTDDEWSLDTILTVTD